MAKKDKAPETKIEETSLDGMIALTPEQFVEMQGGGMQTVMSIGLAERLNLEDRQDRILYLDGEVDDLPEQAFLNVGTIDDAIAKGKKLLEQVG